MSLEQVLINTPQDGVGADTYSRYEYQNCYGLALAFKLHPTGQDYAVAFEFHDDILLLNSSTKPTRIKFYQIKTKKSGEWSLSELTQRKAGKDQSKLASKLGKLFSQYQSFSTYIDALHFVSNIPVAFLTKKGTEQCFIECSANDLRKLHTKLKAEHNWLNEDHIKILFYTPSDLSLPDTNSHFKGKLESFIVSQIGEGQINTSALCRAMLDQCRKMSSSTTKIATLDDLINHKCLTRKQVEEWLQHAKEQARIIPSWDKIELQLSGIGWQLKKEINKEFSKYGLLILDAANEAVQKIREIIKKAIAQRIDQSGNLEKYLAELVGDTKEAIEANITPCTPAFTMAAILYELSSNE